MTREEWINAKLTKYGEGPVNAGKVFVELVSEAGGRAEVAKLHGSMVAVFDLAVGPIYPMSLGEYGKVALNLIYLQTRSPFTEEQARKDLYDRVVKVVGSLSTQNLTGFPAFDAAMLNEP